MRKFTLALFLFTALNTIAQDTLPSFSVNSRGNNRIVISWFNKYPAVKQISIQRSFDSLNNYKTILTVPDPMNRQNGYMDTKAANDQMFYRLYVLLDGGHFLFTRAQRPFSDSMLIRIINKSLTDSALTEEEMTILRRYQNTKLKQEKDILARELDNGLKDKNKPGVITPTYRITTNREGNVRLRLNDFDSRKYSIKFFEEDDSFLFELKEIKEPFLILDKSNFLHSGWFRFELYDDGKLVEKSKFYLARDF